MRFLFLALSFFLTFSFGSQELKKLSLQLEWKHQFEFAGFYAAIEQGYYKEIGVELELKEFHPNINTVNEVIDGKSDFGISSSSLIIESFSNKPVVLLASYFKQNALALVTKENIHTAKDLKNKKIMALPWEVKHTSLGALLKDANLKEEDYTLIPHDFHIDKFVKEEVDAMSIFLTSQPYDLDTLGVKYNILNPAQSGIFSYDMELFTSKEFIDKDPKLVEKFIQATNKGWEYALQHQEQIVDLILEKYSQRKSRESLLYEAKKTQELFKTNLFQIGAIVPELIILNTELYSKLGLIPKDANIQKTLQTYLFTNYINNTNQSTRLSDEEKQYLQTNTIKVHNESDWVPYNYNFNGSAQGFSIEYMKLLASKVGMNLQFISGHTWQEYLDMIKTKDLDIMLNIVQTPQRKNYLKFLPPYSHTTNAVYVRGYESNYKKLSDFNNKRLGVVKGFYEEEILKKHYPKIQLVTYENTLSSIKALAFGEVQGIINDFYVVDSLIKLHSIPNLKPAFDIKDTRFSLALSTAVNKDNNLLYSILQKASKQIQEIELIDLRKKWLSKSTLSNNISIFSSNELSYLETKKSIRMCINPDWLPFEKVEKEKHIGITKEFFDLFKSHLSTPIEVVSTTTFEESISNFKEKKCDILSTAVENSFEKDFANFTKSYITVPLVIITLKDVLFIDSFESLKGKKLAIAKGYSLKKILEKKYPFLTFTEVETSFEGLQKVNDQEFFGYIDTLWSIKYLFQTNFFDTLKIAGKFDDTLNLSIAVQSDDQTLLKVLNKLIDTITFEQNKEILDRWIQSKYEKEVDYTLLIQISFISFLLITIILYWNSKLKKLNEELIKSQQEVAYAMQAKSDFLSNISHEIKTPLHAITGLTYILSLTNLMPKQQDYVKKIDNAAQILSKLMNDLLDFNKLEGNKFNLQKTIFNIDKFLNDIENTIQPQADEKGLQFSIKKTGITKEHFFGDSVQLMKVILILINNALKFTPKGSVILEIKYMKDNIYRFSVSDTGIGIKPEDIPTLFKPFSQLDTQTNKKHYGVGISLAYANKIIEFMDGTIEVESELYQGSTFSFEISLEDPNEQVHLTQDITNSDTLTKETDFKTKQKTLKALSSEEFLEQLTLIHELLQQQRPAKIMEKINEIEQTKLNLNNEKLLIQIKKLSKEYKFKEAIKVIDENK